MDIPIITKIIIPAIVDKIVSLFVISFLNISRIAIALEFFRRLIRLNLFIIHSIASNFLRMFLLCISQKITQAASLIADSNLFILNSAESHNIIFRLSASADFIRQNINVLRIVFLNDIFG